MEQNPNLLCSFLDQDGKLISCNLPFLLASGFPSMDLLQGKTIAEAFRNWNADSILQAIAHCQNKPGETQTLEVRQEGPGGKLDYQWTFYAGFNAAGQKGIHAIGENISRRKQAEKDLIHQATLLENIEDAVISTDENFIVRTWNRAAEKIYGIPAEKAIGRPMQELVAYEYIGSDRLAAQKALKQKQQWKGRVKIQNGQKQLLLECSVTPVMEQNALIGYVAVNRDLTEMASLESSLQGFYSIFSSLDEGFFLLDKQLKLVYFNQKAVQNASRAYHFHPQIGDHLLEILPEYRQQPLAALLSEVLMGHESSYEIEAKVPGNISVWLQCRYFPVRDSFGSVTGICGLIKDITAQKELHQAEARKRKAEKELQHSRKLFEHFMSTVPLAAWITDENNCIRYMSPAYCFQFGLKPSDVNKSIFSLFPPEIAGEFRKNDLQVLREKKVLVLEEKVAPTDGSLRRYKVYKFPIWVEDQWMVGGWAEDITEHLQLKEKLTTSIERYEWANKATSDAVFEWDLESNTMYKGRGFETLFGQDIRSLLVRFDLIHPDDRKRVHKKINEALNNPKCDKWQIEYRYRTQEELYKNVLSKAFILRKEGKAVKVIGAVQDISEQKLLQEKLLKQEKKTKREMVKSIIETQEKERRQLSVELHDNVNQILASCKLMLEVARESRENAPMLTEKSYQSLIHVIAEIRRISHNLNPSTIEDVSLIDAIRDMVEKINLSGKLLAVFSAGSFPEKPLLSPSDNIAIYRIVQEQLNNVVKHAEARHVYVRLFCKQTKIFLEIMDDGRGFNLAKVKKGLGLRNILHRVEYYNGKIKVHTRPGGGCRMKVLLHIQKPGRA